MTMLQRLLDRTRALMAFAFLVPLTLLAGIMFLGALALAFPACLLHRPSVDAWLRALQREFK